MGTRDREPRASALGWYEIGPWPESEGAFSSAQIGKRGGRYIRIYIVPIYSRCSDALLSRLLKNSVLHPLDEARAEVVEVGLDGLELAAHFSRDHR